MQTPFSPGSIPVQEIVMGPQVDVRFWQSVLPTARISGVVRPPVTGIPAAVENVMQLRKVTSGYSVHDQQFYYP